LGPGDSKVSKKKNAVTYLINRMKQNLPVELYDGGEFVRDYIHVNDLCKAVHIVMESGQVNEIYNIGNGVPTRFADIVQDVLELGSTSEVKNIQTADLHKNVQVKNIYMDTEKLKKLGYTPEHNIKSTIIELFYLQNSR
jgi:dTDP-glucose 4,6-dehydratase